jgi:hypothetical protein
VPGLTSYGSGIPNQAILSELKEVDGKDVISLRAVEKWTTVLDGRGTELIDLPRYMRRSKVRAYFRRRSHICWASTTKL